MTVAEVSDNKDKDETLSDDILKEINKTCFPRLSKVEDTNDMIRALATLVYFKLKQQLLREAKQFEAAARYKINQKCLSEILHGKKCLGGGGTEEMQSIKDQGRSKLIEDKDKEGKEEEEREGPEEQGEVSSQKQKSDDDDNNDDVFEGTTKEFTTKPVPKKSKLSKSKHKNQ